MIAAVVLAAGRATRFGAPKQLATVGGRSLVQLAVDAAAGGGADEVVVVLGHLAAEIEDELSLPSNARVVVNADYAEGQSTSLRSGLEALSPGARAAVVLLADEPGVTADDVRAVIATHGATGAAIVRARYRGRPGHPVLIDAVLFAEAKRATGDAGARGVVRAHAEKVAEVDIDRNPPRDVDTPEDLRAAALEAATRGDRSSGAPDVSQPDNPG